MIKKKIKTGDSDTITKYRDKIGVLTTAGSNEDRITKLIDLHAKLYPSEDIKIINALDLNTETKLTAASYYKKAQTFL